MSDDKKLVVVVTRGCDDERASVAWSIANGGIASGYNITMFLVSAGADWARKGAADHARLNPLDPPVSEMMQNVIESGGQTAMFLGDAASWPIHVERLSWVPAYDVEPLISIETKRNLARWAVESKALLIFNHHPGGMAGTLHPTDRTDRFRLEPVAI